jgi:outer membrane protein OmpA-like peptidoglycan-associated protein
MLVRRLTALCCGILVPLLLAGGATAQDREEPPEATAKKGPDVRQPDPTPGAQAPTINGPTGLFRLVTMDVGTPHTFRVGLHFETFKSSDFLVRGDENSFYMGTLGINYTPIKFAEFFLSTRSSSNSNSRPAETDRLDQEVILALGDLSFGGKGMYHITPAIGIGAHMALTLLNSVGGVSLDGDSTSFAIGMISSFDLDPLANFPLRFHLNVGYNLDNSNNLAEFEGYSLASLQVEKFALGIRPPRVEFKFGLDLPLRKYINFGLTPMIELCADFATGDADADFSGHPKMKPDQLDGVTTMWMTIGVRSNPVAGFIVELGSDIGMVDPGYGYGPPVKPWNLIIGLGYAYDPNPPTKVVEREKVREVVKTVHARPPGGKLRGRVINAKTLEPVDGAVVTFPGKDLTGLSTDPDGTFLTYEMAGGNHPVMVRHPDYKPGKLMAAIKVGAVNAMDIKLEPAPPKIGKLSGRVTDLKGNGVAASITAAGEETKQIDADAAGTFSAELKPGAYSLQVSAPKFLRKEIPVTIAAGGQATADITLSPRPRRSLVRVTKKAIIIHRKVHFATGAATIMPDSRQLLDSVVDVLLANSNISRVEIQGHTDNRGKLDFNMQLSQARADAVRDYLVKNGISASRLEAKGYGPTRPKVPNFTARNRARNRRVEFMILAQ